MKKWITKFDGTDHAFLSNFQECQCGYEGMEFLTTEAAFQAAKTLDLNKRALIQKCAPGASKRMGRSVDLREDWEEIKDDVMLTVLRSKFKNNEDLREKLLATGDAVLIEGNVWHDSYWGVCNCEKCGGVGKNMLGTLLMQVRDEIRTRMGLAKAFGLEEKAAFGLEDSEDAKEDPYNGA